jgi:DNA-binding transcriptional LysR family regulator
MNVRAAQLGGNARIRSPGVQECTGEGFAMFEWDDLRVFLAVLRTGSHAGAARQLRVAPTTVGRRLAALEAAAGARLFARNADGLVPSATARALATHAERVEAEVNEAERQLTGADARPTGTVRITCGDGFAAQILAPALPAFLAAHPGLSVEVRAEVRSLDLTRGEADVALRLFRPRERSLVARRLGTERYALYATPAYLALRGTPRTARDLAGHDLLLYDRDLDRMKAQAWLRRTAVGAREVFRASNTMTLHEACAAGAGIGLLMQSTARGDPRLARVLPQLEPPPLERWAATHAALRGNARVVAALRWLEQLVRATEVR